MFTNQIDPNCIPLVLWNYCQGFIDQKNKNHSLPFSVPTRTLPAGSQFDGISCSGGFGESGGFPSDLDQTLTIEGCHINSIPMF